MINSYMWLKNIPSVPFIERIPVPYNKLSIKAYSDLSTDESNALTSCRVSTTGKCCGRLALSKFVN